MGDPVTMAVITGSAAGANAYGQIQQGRAEKSAANLQASFLEAQARDALDRGVFEAAKRTRATKRLLGGQRAAMAAQGLDLSFGSASDIQGETETIGALDALMIKTNAAREAWGLKSQASMTRYEGKMKLRAAKWQAFNTLLAGGAEAAKMAGSGGDGGG